MNNDVIERAKLGVELALRNIDYDVTVRGLTPDEIHAIALAVLRAVREPSEAMIDNGLDEMEVYLRKAAPDHFVDAKPWREQAADHAHLLVLMRGGIAAVQTAAIASLLSDQPHSPEQQT